jgi:hypothetical protein
LEIEKEYIHPRQSWENLVETHFNVMRRMTQVYFEQVTSWQGAKLARHPAVIWLHGDALTVEYQETPLAQYTVRYQPDKKYFKEVPDARRFETPYRSLQGRLWKLDETMWKLAKRLPEYAPRRKRRNKSMPIQLSLLENSQTTQG